MRTFQSSFMVKKKLQIYGNSVFKWKWTLRFEANFYIVYFELPKSNFFPFFFQEQLETELGLHVFRNNDTFSGIRFICIVYRSNVWRTFYYDCSIGLSVSRLYHVECRCPVNVGQLLLKCPLVKYVNR